MVFRFGGDEFIIILPYTGASQAYVFIDRIREKWSQRKIVLPDGRVAKTTLSAGIAEYQKGQNIQETADKAMYESKKAGRNKVKVTYSQPKILVLGEINTNLIKAQNLEITYDPEQAGTVIADSKSVKYAPHNLPIYVLGTGTVTDWLIKKENPDAVICQTVEEIIEKLKSQGRNDFSETPNNLSVLPGARVREKSQTIPRSGVLYIVCPSRPAGAGEIAAQICRSVKNAALICATGESTGALEIGIPEKTLITSDWRIPGSKAPVKWEGVTVWPVDIYKNIRTTENIYNLIDQIKHRFSLVVVDCGGSLSTCSRVAGDEGVLLIHKEGDASDKAARIWIESYRGRNVMSISPSEIPSIIEAKNGFIVQCS